MILSDIDDELYILARTSRIPVPSRLFVETIVVILPLTVAVLGLNEVEVAFVCEIKIGTAAELARVLLMTLATTV